MMNSQSLLDRTLLVSSTFMSVFCTCTTYSYEVRYLVPFSWWGCHGTKKRTDQHLAGGKDNPCLSFPFSFLSWSTISLNLEFIQVPHTVLNAIHSVRALLCHNRCSVSTIRFYVGCTFVDYERTCFKI